jgi:hypothetical protein
MSFVPPSPDPGAAARTSTMAIIAFVASFIVPVVGLILGILARREVARTHESGEGLARAAFIIGLVLTALQVAFFVAWLALFLSLWTRVAF